MKQICDCEACQELANSGPEGRAFAEALWEMENDGTVIKADGTYRPDLRYLNQ